MQPSSSNEEPDPLELHTYHFHALSSAGNDIVETAQLSKRNPRLDTIAHLRIKNLTGGHLTQTGKGINPQLFRWTPDMEVRTLRVIKEIEEYSDVENTGIYFCMNCLSLERHGTMFYFYICITCWMIEH